MTVISTRSTAFMIDNLLSSSVNSKKKIIETEFVSQTPDNYINNNRRKREKPHACSTCGKAFSTSSSLNTHCRIHSGEKPHSCEVCGKRFTASSNLYYHRMTHTKKKPHKCSYCDKTFATPGDLRGHTHIHQGTWPFRCHQCSKGFSKQTNLKNHLLTHTGRKDHKCDICGKLFSLHCNLKSHQKLHRNMQSKNEISRFARQQSNEENFFPDIHDQDEPTSTTNDIVPNQFFSNKFSVDLLQLFSSVRSYS
ncbi:unnamed protein product [Rotaria magnacalcarata]|uniref:Zinc finger protein 865 n=1 Tax=Rotaria magnacalcarata TaxID=392030 RepID=A0A818YXJ9_9BILA|nr:unnamed protein product [Rotaria magnacalcarata]